MASAGSVSNTIPEDVRGIGDMRADDIADLALLEASIREKILKRLIPNTSVDVHFECLFIAVDPSRLGGFKVTNYPGEYSQGVTT